MKVKTTQDVSNVDSLEDLVRYTGKVFGDILTEFNGRVDFLDNCRTSLVSFTFTTANLEYSIPHTLSRVPQGYILVGASVAMSLYNGTSANTTSAIFLKSNAIGTASILIF